MLALSQVTAALPVVTFMYFLVNSNSILDLISIEVVILRCVTFWQIFSLSFWIVVYLVWRFWFTWILDWWAKSSMLCLLRKLIWWSTWPFLKCLISFISWYVSSAFKLFKFVLFLNILLKRLEYYAKPSIWWLRFVCRWSLEIFFYLMNYKR